MEDLKKALHDLHYAAYVALRAGRDTTVYPMLNRQRLREIARLTDEAYEDPGAD